MCPCRVLVTQRIHLLNLNANYLHLKDQRTQIYGNLWYKNGEGYDFKESDQNLDWKQLNFQPSEQKQTYRYSFAKKVLNKIKNFNKNNLESNLIDRSRKDNYR